MIKHLKLILVLVAVGATTFLGSCTDYVTNIKSPIDDTVDDSLYSPEDLPILTNGIKALWVVVWDETSIFAGGLSDELEFTNDISGATYTTYRQLDLGEYGVLLTNNNSTGAIMDELGRLRLHADTLIERINKRMVFDPANDQHTEWKREALYTANFYGAMARYIWASYWSLEPNDGGGGVINCGPYIPAATMYTDAIAKLDEALKYADEAEAAITNSFKARIYLLQGKYSEASAAAELGMADGAEDFAALYNKSENNYWYYWAGPGRTQFHAADRFADYTVEDPLEENRIPLYTIRSKTKHIWTEDVTIGGITYKAGDTTYRYYFQQYKYNEMAAPLPFLTWQENTLMKAEIAIRNSDNPTGLGLINEVRASHGLVALTADDVTSKYAGNYLDLIYVERDKELCFTGMRLIDERRFPGKWHLSATAWHFFPISYEERKINPNFD